MAQKSEEKKLQELKERNELEFVKETSEAMQRYNMKTTGSVSLDERVRQFRNSNK